MNKVLKNLMNGQANIVWFKVPDIIPDNMKNKKYLVAYEVYGFMENITKEVGIGYYSDYCNDGWVSDGMSVNVIAIASIPEFPETFQDLYTTCCINS